MGLATELTSEVNSILRSQWSIREGQIVPDTSEIKLLNDGVKLNATVLYADIDGSTTMVDQQSPEFAAEVYKSYLVCAARLIKSEGGAITAYDGDRVMAVFLGDSKNTNAVRCAMKIKAAVKNIINPAIKDFYKNDFSLRQVVGVDTSSLLVARTGIRGSNDLVWVGSAANYAAKLSSISEQPYSTFITKTVYDSMNKSLKTSSNGSRMWEDRNWKGKSIRRSSWFWNIPN